MLTSSKGYETQPRRGQIWLEPEGVYMQPFIDVTIGGASPPPDTIPAYARRRPLSVKVDRVFISR